MQEQLLSALSSDPRVPTRLPGLELFLHAVPGPYVDTGDQGG